jgi:hypothetical protein
MVKADGSIAELFELIYSSRKRKRKRKRRKQAV